jgi:hypothetical protein
MSLGPESVKIVQKTTTWILKFTTSHALLTNAKIEVKMPAGVEFLDLPGTYSSGYTVNSLPAVAVIKEGQTIEILDFIGDGVTMQGGTDYELKLRSITNQISTQDAGSYSVTTFNMIEGDHYPVNKGE